MLNKSFPIFLKINNFINKNIILKNIILKNINNVKYNININNINILNISSRLIVKYICKLLKKNINIKKIFNKISFILDNTENVMGYKIQCKGRF